MSWLGPTRLIATAPPKAEPRWHPLDQEEVAWPIAAETALAQRDTSWPGGLEDLLHADFVEIGHRGRHWTRAEIVVMLVAEPPNDRRLLDAAIALLANDVAQLPFETGSGDGRTWRSSIWVREVGRRRRSRPRGPARLP